MSKASKREVVFYTKWNKQDLKCACLFSNPLCKDCDNCEELEMTLSPYDDVVECMKNTREEKRRSRKYAD